jgi:hypothetical protein
MQYTNPDGLTLEVPGYLDVLDMDADFKAFVDSLPDFGPVNVVAVGGDHLVNENDDSKLFATPSDCQLRLTDGLPTGFQIAAWSEEGFVTIVSSEQVEASTEIPPDLVGIVTKVRS